MDVTSYLLGKKAGGGSAPVLQDKEVEITENGETTITADSGYDGLRSVDVDTNVQPDLETKSITITENTTTTITPTSGKDGLSSVEITTNVQSGGGKYAPRFIAFTSYTGNELDNEIINLDTSNITSFQNMFASAKIESFPSEINDWNTSNITRVDGLFKSMNYINKIDVHKWDATKITTTKEMFYNLSVPILTEVNLSGWNTLALKETSSMFFGQTNLTKIDIRNFDFTQVTQYYSSMFGANASSGPPNNCLIIVKDATQKQWITSKFSRLTNVKTVAEYEGS